MHLTAQITGFVGQAILYNCLDLLALCEIPKDIYWPLTC